MNRTGDLTWTKCGSTEFQTGKATGGEEARKHRSPGVAVREHEQEIIGGRGELAGMLAVHTSMSFMQIGPFGMVAVPCNSGALL